jgi:hypothetical protein
MYQDPVFTNEISGILAPLKLSVFFSYSIYHELFLQEFHPESDEDEYMVEDAPGASPRRCGAPRRICPGLPWVREPFLLLELMEYIVRLKFRISFTGSFAWLKPFPEISCRGLRHRRGRSPRERHKEPGFQQSGNLKEENRVSGPSREVNWSSSRVFPYEHGVQLTAKKFSDRNHGHVDCPDRSRGEDQTTRVSGLIPARGKILLFSGFLRWFRFPWRDIDSTGLEGDIYLHSR